MRNTDMIAQTPPIIIAGMHRSGTTILVSLLEQLGFYAGRRYGKNREAKAFLQLDDWLLMRAGGAWDYPLPFADAVQDQEFLTLAETAVGNAMHEPLFKRHMAQARQAQAWGWKGPRSTITLPIWLAIFPNARIVYMHRHGVDVAASLRARALAKENIETLLSPLGLRQRAIAAIFGRESGTCSSYRCTSLENSFKLWEEYCGTFANYSDLTSQVLCVRYETLLKNPIDTLQEISQFCGLSPTREKVEHVAKQVNSGRSLAFRSDPELYTFAKSVESRLHTLEKTLGL